MRRLVMFILAGIAILVTIAAVIIWWTTPEPGVCGANYARIRKGMQRFQVQQVLGGPSRIRIEETTFEKEFKDSKYVSVEIETHYEIWSSSKMYEATHSSPTISVRFDCEGRVLDKQIRPEPPPGFIDSIRQWAGL